MPGGDKRGPNGEGPMTGRSVGYCADNDQPGYMNPGPGGGGMRRGQGGQGGGLGRRWRRGAGGFGRARQQLNPADATATTSRKSTPWEELKDVIAGIQARLSRLEGHHHGNS